MFLGVCPASENRFCFWILEPRPCTITCAYSYSAIFYETRLPRQMLQHSHYRMCRTARTIVRWHGGSQVFVPRWLRLWARLGGGRVTPTAGGQHCHPSPACSGDSGLHSLGVAPEGRKDGHAVRMITGQVASGGELLSWMLIRDVCPGARCGWGRDGVWWPRLENGLTGVDGGGLSEQRGTDCFLLQLLIDAGASKWRAVFRASWRPLDRSVRCFKVLLLRCFHTCCSFAAKPFSTGNPHSAVTDQRSGRANVLLWVSSVMNRHNIIELMTDFRM